MPRVSPVRESIAHPPSAATIAHDDAAVARAMRSRTPEAYREKKILPMWRVASIRFSKSDKTRNCAGVDSRGFPNAMTVSTPLARQPDRNILGSAFDWPEPGRR